MLVLELYSNDLSPLCFLHGVTHHRHVSQDSLQFSLCHLVRKFVPRAPRYVCAHDRTLRDWTSFLVLCLISIGIDTAGLDRK